MIKVGLIAISLMLMTACGDSEPVATSYKKSMGAPAGALPGATPPGAGDATALKAQGTTVYNAKCASCHGALAASAKKGATAARITASATITSHSSVTPFPTGTDVTALEAALK
jgi:thiosulfate dehydrogenase